MNALDDIKYPGISEEDVEDINDILKVKGKKPSEGTIIYENGLVKEASNLCINGYYVTYKDKKAEVTGKCSEAAANLVHVSKTDVRSTLDSITLPIETEEGTEVTLTYEEYDKNGQKVGENTITCSDTCNLDNLKTGYIYKYTITARKNGLTKIKSGSIETRNFNNIRISEDNSNWSKKKTITIETEEELGETGTKLEYKVGEGSWAEYEEAFEVNENTTVYARLVNGENVSETKTITITKIDTVAPTCGEFSGESTEWAASRIISVGCTDSVGECTKEEITKKYEDSIKTTKVEIIISDKAGNTTTCEKNNANIYVDNTNPNLTIDDVLTKKNSITIKYTSNDDVSEISSVKCKYGTNANSMTNEVECEDNKCILPNLTEDETYYYNVISTNSVNLTASKSGNATASAPKVCKRVTNSSNLHTSGTTTFGNAKAIGQPLAAGDAFDCDVNNNGEYSSTDERFYYITTTNNNAVLVHNKNYTGTGTTPHVSYNYGKWDLQLPTTSAWSNSGIIYPTTRMIKKTNGSNYMEISYSGYAARLLTYQEFTSVCGGQNITNNCSYLAENMCMYGSCRPQYTWLETSNGSSSSYLIYCDGGGCVISTGYASRDTAGNRPVIEVSLDNIEY